jgi:hypothetical protein
MAGLRGRCPTCLYQFTIPGTPYHSLEPQDEDEPDSEEETLTWEHPDNRRLLKILIMTGSAGIIALIATALYLKRENREIAANIGMVLLVGSLAAAVSGGVAYLCFYLHKKGQLLPMLEGTVKVLVAIMEVIATILGVLATVFMMAMSGTKRPLNSCGRCGHTWYPRGSNYSAYCPHCRARR